MKTLLYYSGSRADWMQTASRRQYVMRRSAREQKKIKRKKMKRRHI
jgi:hypothetical protein